MDDVTARVQLRWAPEIQVIHKKTIVVFTIRQLSILIQSFGEKIGSGWQPPAVDGEE